MITTTIVKMTPNETTTDGFLKLKEWGQPMLFKFQQDPDFRGKLAQVEWDIGDGVITKITPEDEDFARFRQVGERPEIEVDISWFYTLELPQSVFFRIKFTFETFRMEPAWYGYLYFRTAYGDSEKTTDAAYKLQVGATDLDPDCPCINTDKCCKCCADCDLWFDDFDEDE